MKFLAVGALFVRTALASSYIFGFITNPGCAPCLDGVIARGPGAIESIEFATYICMGSGGSAAAVCISGCGTGGLGVIEEAALTAELEILLGSFFDYW